MESGHTLGHYRLVEKLGEGGMGVVWRAVDSTLDREVAIKILPGAVEQHPDRLDRFEREAKVLASLHHPNIAVLHGLHHEQGVRFLVMELVGGEDLSERLARGPLPTLDALKLCAQVARALQAAHDRNVVHRDLKPANIVLTESGEAKVLDFGLAKVLDPEAGERGEESSAPTVTTGGTVAGVIMGTAAYMSPEQARGKATDRRTDIWSFGCVLYECLTGISEFRGETMSDSIGAILHKAPEWNALPADLPVTVRWLLKRCLTKDRDNRLHDIADARIELEQAIVNPQAEVAGDAKANAASSRRPWLLPAATVVLVAAAALAGWALKPEPLLERPVASLSLDLTHPQEWTDFTLSPDGKTLVYRALDPVEETDKDPESRLWMRRLDSFVATPIGGTEGADQLAFSPDGRMVTFVKEHEGGGAHQADLRVVGLDGRPPLTIATNATDHSPPRWLSNDEIVFVDHKNEKRLLAVSRGGGDPRTYLELPRESRFVSFDFDIVVARGWILANTFLDAQPSVIVIDPESGREVELLRDARAARALSDGRILFVRSSALLLAQIDLGSFPPTVVGDVRSVMGSGSDPSDRIRSLAVSEAGHLAFVTGEGFGENRSLMTVDRQGRVEPLVEAKGSYASPLAFSPDGRMLAVVNSSDETPAELWVVELDTGGRRRMALEENVTTGGRWVSGDRLVFTAWTGIDEGRILIREMRRNAQPEPLYDDWPEDLILQSGRLAFDGTNLLFDVAAGQGENMDIYFRPVDGTTGPRPLVATAATENEAALSPDRKWLAYQSNESGRREVYVRRHSTTGELDDEVVKVSRTGGDEPVWSRDSRELFFFDRRQDRLLSVTVEDGGRIQVTEPNVVIEDLESLQASRHWDSPELIPTPDGERFAFVQTAGAESKIDRIEIVLNWAELLER